MADPEKHAANAFPALASCAQTQTQDKDHFQKIKTLQDEILKKNNQINEQNEKIQQLQLDVQQRIERDLQRELEINEIRKELKEMENLKRLLDKSIKEIQDIKKNQEQDFDAKSNLSQIHNSQSREQLQEDVIDISY